MSAIKTMHATPSHLAPSIEVTPFKVLKSFTDSEDFMILAYTVLIQSQSVTNGRTGRQTPGR